MPLTTTNLVLTIPLLHAAGTLIALLTILRLLRRHPELRGMTWPYLIGSVTLSVSLLLPTLIPGFTTTTVDHVLLAVQIFMWGAVGLDLFEYILVKRWVQRRGVAVPRLARDIARAVAFILAILITLQLVFNIAPSSIVISSTILSAVIGLALQDLLRNVIAGVALQLEQPFTVGHWIQVGDGVGKVVEMSWRATRVLTVDGNYIIYPNAELATSRLINYTLPDPVQAMHSQIALSYIHPPNVVKRVLVEAILASPFVTPDPPPSVKVLSYGDYSVTYDLKFWLYNYDRHPDKRDSVMTNAWYALQRAGLKMPLPVREVYHHQESDEELEGRRRDHLMRIATDLRSAPVLAVLDDNELSSLAERVHARLYGTGDVLVREGEQGATLFILRTGRVRVDVRAPDGTAVTVNRLGPGECFGEMALMTGAPRGATVTAEEDTELLLVAKDDIAPLLKANPELPERLGRMLAERQEMNRAVLAQRQANGEEDDLTPRVTLVARIRQFFGIDDDR